MRTDADPTRRRVMTDMERQPISARVSTADWLAWGALALAAIAAAAGLFVPHLYRDTDAWVRQAQASDLTAAHAFTTFLNHSYTPRNKKHRPLR